jgi:hypothetical protein
MKMKVDLVEAALVLLLIAILAMAVYLAFFAPKPYKTCVEHGYYETTTIRFEVYCVGVRDGETVAVRAKDLME